MNFDLLHPGARTFHEVASLVVREAFAFFPMAKKALGG
jgi:hypothetical protein